MIKKYEKRIEKYEKELKSQKSISSNIGILKFITLIVTIYQIYKIFNIDSNILNITTLITIIFLVYLFLKHVSIDSKIKNTKKKIEINGNYIKRINGSWNEFKKDGSEFIVYDHPYSQDLDIVGHNSLFQFLNITNTWHGQEAFKNDLLTQNYNKDEIIQRQKAIKELSEKATFIEEFETLSTNINNNKNIIKLIDEVKNKNEIIKNNNVKILIKIFPILTMLSFFINIQIIFYIFIAIQMLLFLSKSFQNYQKLETVKHLNYNLKDYRKLIELIKKENFSSDKLNEIQKCLELNALKNIKKLESILSFRNNIISYFILNILFLIDHQCVFILEKWKQENEKLEVWFTAIGELESLLCFSILPNVSENTTIPIFNDFKNIKAKNIGHPLLKARVLNDFESKNNIFIISGSNMSGKTTFLRTIGINLILLNCGSYVCAEHFESNIFEIYTSMRISDDLQGISTFYAELKRIKMILDNARLKNNCYFLIDEIFRGTNSYDRLIGAKNVLMNLDKLNIDGIITTHDLEMCKLESEKIKNLSFKEFYENDQIKFDYKIKKGFSTTTNAKFLMKLVGIELNENL